MAEMKQSSADLDIYRVKLEEFVDISRLLLQYWQTWEAEYDGFKEEILGLGEHHTDAELEEVGKEFGGTHLNEKEIQLLLVNDKGDLRDSQQIVGLISRRIDYVQDNVKAVKKRLDTAEEELKASFIPPLQESMDERRLPVTEIREELDENDKVISSSTSTPSNATPQIVEALHKAGIKDLREPRERDLPNSQPTNHVVGDLDKVSEAQQDSVSTIKVPDIDEANRLNSVLKTSATKSPKRPGSGRKKSVSFAEGTKEVDASTSESHSFAKLLNRGRPDAKAATFPNYENFNHDLWPVNGEDDSDNEPFSPIIPTDESPDDAALRREMLQYNMTEIGAIVAQIDLDDEDDDSSHTTFSDDEDDGSKMGSEEEEDNFGRTRQRVLDDNYRRKMLELEKKLNATAIEHVGPHLDVVELNVAKNNGVQNSSLHETSASQGTKEVRFADGLDIQNLHPTNQSELAAAGSVPIPQPIREAVVERVATSSVVSEPPRKKVSRFKSSRNGGSSGSRKDDQSIDFSQSFTITESPSGNSPETTRPKVDFSHITSLPTALETKSSSKPVTFVGEARVRKVPEGPPGRTHSDIVLERPYENIESNAQEPDDLDASLIHQEIATEYHRMRNRIIQRQGGFSAPEEEAEQPTHPERDGEGPKISRFKAARLARSGK